MVKKVIKLNSMKNKNDRLQLNNRTNITRLEAALNELEELNIEKQQGTLSIKEYYLRKSKIIKKLYTPGS